MDITAILPAIVLFGVPLLFLLWMLWPARTGAVAAGEKGNDGLIPSTGDGTSGLPPAPE